MVARKKAKRKTVRKRATRKTVVKKLDIIRSPNYTKLYVTNVAGGLTDHDIRFELLNEKIKDEATKTWHFCFL